MGLASQERGEQQEKRKAKHQKQEKLFDHLYSSFFVRAVCTFCDSPVSGIVLEINLL